MSSLWRPGVAAVGLVVAGLLPGGPAGAGPRLDLAQSLVAPGTVVAVTVEGAPGAFFALAASPSGGGLVVREQALALGADARVLATGQLDAAGRATVTVAPDFAAGPALYLQAVTAPTPAFDLLAPTPGKVLRDVGALLRQLQVDLPGSRGRAAPGPGGEAAPLLAAALAGREGFLGCLGCVTTPALANQAVTAAKLAAGAVTAGAVAPAAIGASALAPGAVGAAQIDPAQVQARVGGTCPPGQYLRAVNPDGSAGCAPLVARHAATTVDDPADPVGQYSTIAIGADGLPIIAHRSLEGGGSLRVTHCDNVACTSATSTTVDDPADPVGFEASIAIGADSLPIISHNSQEGGGSLRVTHCDNVACTSATSTTVDDPADFAGAWTSIAIGVDGLPIISHESTEGGGSLRVTHCDNVACTSATSTTVDDPAAAVGAWTSITIGADGLPIIGHQSQEGGFSLRVTHCDNVACTSATSATVDDPADDVGQYVSIALGADGLPIISHRSEEGGSSLRVTHCDNVVCTSAISTTLDDPADGVGAWTSIALGTDGLPIISHQSQAGGGSLRLTHCDNVACTSAISTTVDDPADPVGSYTSIALGADGLPIISHRSGEGGGSLRVTHCATAACP